ncbi:UNVERIFIED_CONTAM: hypothetical protein K2H54_004478 [Gekko kuhli]
MATAVTLRRHAWLRSALLQTDIKQRTEDLPFDGCGLFHKTTDDALRDADESRRRARNLVVHTQYPLHSLVPILRNKLVLVVTYNVTTMYSILQQGEQPQ